MSFFDDGDETTRQSARTPRPPERPSPRRPQRSGEALPIDQHTVMVRRRVAAGVGVVALIVIVLLINGCLKSQASQALKNYNKSVSVLGRESVEKVSSPLFSALNGAGSKSALNVEVQVDQLRLEAQSLASRANALSVPGDMAGAQRNFVLAFDLRTEGVTKVAALLPAALGGQGKTASTLIAGDMEIFLASDVIYSQRVAPLIQQTLASNGIHGLSTAPSRFLPNLGWLDPATVQARIGGQSSSTQGGEVPPGHHGSALKGVSVGQTMLESGETVNHIHGGANPTFTAMVENAGEFVETNVKTDVTVTAAGKQFTASHMIEKTEPGKTVSVAIPVQGVPLGVGAKVEVAVQPVPGETNHEGTKSSYLAVFEK